MAYYSTETKTMAPNTGLKDGLTDAELAQYGLVNYNPATMKDANQPSPYPTYQPSYNPLSMGVSTGFNQDMGGAQAASDQFTQEALRKGPSAWANLQNQQLDQQKSQAMDRAAGSAAGAGAGAMSSLAMRGGLDSGARERIARGTGRNALSMQQDVNAKDSANRLQVGENDEKNRIQQLSMAPSMGTGVAQAKLGAKQYDIGNQIGETDKRNLFNMGLYHENMAAWAAGQQANATEKSSSSWLCTEALKDFGRDEWKALLRLRRFAARKDLATTAFYIYECKPLVDRMKALGADWELNKKFVARIVKLVGEGKLERAYQLYFRVIRHLITKYWPECDHPVYLRERSV